MWKVSGYGPTGQHLPDDLVDDLAKQTHQHALEYAAEDSSDGRLIFRGGIGPWWCEAAGLTDDEFRRLYKLLTDVVKRLTEQGLAYRPYPQSTWLYVRHDPA